MKFADQEGTPVVDPFSEGRKVFGVPQEVNCVSLSVLPYVVKLSRSDSTLSR